MNKRRILLVDDELGFTRMLKLNLEQTNRYTVRIVNNPEDAIGVAREFHPELVFLDIFMPRMSGGDVKAQFKADPELCQVPIVFFTAAVPKSRVAEHDGIIAGEPFIAKPAPMEDVIACLDKYLPT